MNRELGTDIPLEAVGARRLLQPAAASASRSTPASTGRSVLRIPLLDRSFRIARGERIRTEVSYKYRPEAAVGRGRALRLPPGVEPERRAGPASACSCGGSGRWRRAQPPPAAALAVDARFGPARAPSRWWRRCPRRISMRQHSPLMSPIVWDLGHVASFEKLWLVQRLRARSARSERPSPPRQAGEGLERMYDPLVTPRAQRQDLPLPTAAETRRAMDEVRRQVYARLARKRRRQRPGAAAGAGCSTAASSCTWWRSTRPSTRRRCCRRSPCARISPTCRPSSRRCGRRRWRRCRPRRACWCRAGPS